jgi:hypothetical protein
MFIIPLTMTDRFERLKQRRKAISKEIGLHNELIAALELEDKELEAAEAVLSRFADEGSEVSAKPPDESIPSADAKGKPTGTPTTPTMIMQLLTEASRQGKPGMEPREMQLQIARRWWPGVKSEDVAPTAWRMWKDGRLSKEGSVYSIKQKFTSPPEGWTSAWAKTKTEA